jgi:hypothetical protein
LHTDNALVHCQAKSATDKQACIQDRKIIVWQAFEEDFDKLRKFKYHRDQLKSIEVSPEFYTFWAIFISLIPNIQHFCTDA